jgi:hypothetical protein
VTPATPPVMVTATAPAPPTAVTPTSTVTAVGMPPTGRGGNDSFIWVLPSGALIVLLAGLLLRWVGRAAGR